MLSHQRKNHRRVYGSQNHLKQAKRKRFVSLEEETHVDASPWETARLGQQKTAKKKKGKKERKKEKNGEFKSNRRNVNFCQASRIQLHPCGTVVLSIRSGRAALRRLVTLENTICVTWKTVRLELDSWNGKTSWSIDRLIAVHRRDDRSICQNGN